MVQISEDNISLRANLLRLKAAVRYNVSPDKCHIGCLMLESMLQNPERISQIDAAVDATETNESVARRSMRVANAMEKSGIKPGDAVIIMGPNHLNLCVPFYACHINGYSLCTIDPGYSQVELTQILPYVQAKLVVCQKDCVEKVQTSLAANRMDAMVITFDDQSNDLETFVQKYNGSEINFRPQIYDSSTKAGWLMMTSGTTGMPKVAFMTYANVLNAVVSWWSRVQDKIEVTLTMTSTQWMSALIFFAATPLKPFTRLQSSAPMTPEMMAKCIIKYRPTATGWTPYLLSQFVQSPEKAKAVDLSCFRHILVGGAAIEKAILEQFRLVCKANIILAYGMTEMLVPVFDYNDEVTPFGAAGLPFSEYRYRLVDDAGNDVKDAAEGGELWIKSDVFFEGYFNNPEETSKVYTEDGWFRTGDIFRKTPDGNYYFVDRKKIQIRYLTHWISPLQLEEIIKTHPKVEEACVVPIPNAQTMELAVAAIKRKNGYDLAADEIFDLVKRDLPVYKHLHGGLFFLESVPMTPSGKVHRSKIQEMARTAQRIMPK